LSAQAEVDTSPGWDGTDDGLREALTTWFGSP